MKNDALFITFWASFASAVCYISVNARERAVCDEMSFAGDRGIGERGGAA
jgi:hypothetical protein